MATYLLIGFSLIFYSKYKRAYHIAPRKSDEYKLFIEFLFLVDTSTDHYSAANDRWWMMLYIEASSRSHPVSLLEIVY